MSRIWLFWMFLLLLFSCSETKKEETSGQPKEVITIITDESFKPILDQELAIFHYQYPNDSTLVEYATEDQAFMALINDKADLIIVSRKLSDQEKEIVKAKNVTIRTNKLATDGIAVITNKNFPDSTITESTLKSIFSNKINRWSQISPSMPEKEIIVVIDKNSSSNIRFIKERLASTLDSVKIYAAGSNAAVRQYVRENEFSIGMIGVNEISDIDDAAFKSNLAGIKVLAVGKTQEKDSTKFYQPSQANLSEGLYPFTRPVYVINKSSRVGTASRFTAFLTGDQGQRIILKAGLIPAQMPGREIRIKKE